jgi:hypothetical protein
MRRERLFSKRVRAVLLKKVSATALAMLLCALLVSCGTAQNERADSETVPSAVSAEESVEVIQPVGSAEIITPVGADEVGDGDVDEAASTAAEQSAVPDVSTTTTENAAQKENVSTLPTNTPAAESQVAPTSEATTNSEMPTPETTSQTEAISSTEETTMTKIQISVGGTTLTAIPDENSSADAFLALLQNGPITVSMSDYGGMEKVGPLGTSLPRNDTQISVGPGDVILYQGNQITIYYGTNSWNFTRLAVIEGATKAGLLDVLGTGDVEVTFSLAQ